MAGISALPDARPCKCKRGEPCFNASQTFYHTFKNAPRKSGLHGRRILITSKKQVMRYAQMAQAALGSMPLVRVVDGFLCICPWGLVEPWAVEVMNRYNYSKRFNVPPYPGGYDDQPVIWKRATVVIENEIAKVMELLRDRG